MRAKTTAAALALVIFAVGPAMAGGSDHSCKKPDPKLIDETAEERDFKIVVLDEGSSGWRTAIEQAVANMGRAWPELFVRTRISVVDANYDSIRNGLVAPDSTIVLAIDLPALKQSVEGKFADVIAIDPFVVEKAANRQIGQEDLVRAGEHVAVVAALKFFDQRSPQVIELSEAHLLRTSALHTAN